MQDEARYPSLHCDLPKWLKPEWRSALDEALAKIAALPLPPGFAVTSIYEKYNALRVDWTWAGDSEEAVEGITNELEDRTQGEAGTHQVMF